MSEAIALPRNSLQSPSLRLLGDRGIVRLAARGDSRAFTAIYQRYHQPLYRYCRSIVANEHDALDALQNTMARVLGALPGEQRDIALKPWLYRIAHNESIALIRGRRHHQALSQAEEIQSPCVEQQSHERQRLRQLVSDLKELPERQRGALVMRELSGLSYKEIAAVFATSPAVAKQAVYEARAGLQEQAEGREMSCGSVQRTISDNDRRVSRSRRVRAHLRSCSCCRDFRDAIKSRSGELGAVAPPLSAGTAASVLRGLLGGGGHTGGGGILTAAAGGTAKTVAGSVAVKFAAVTAVTVGIGAGMQATGVTPFAGGAGERPVAEKPASSVASTSQKRFAAQPGRAGQTEAKPTDVGHGYQASPVTAPEQQTAGAVHGASPPAVSANQAAAPSSRPVPPVATPSHIAPTTRRATPIPPVPAAVPATPTPPLRAVPSGLDRP